MNKAFLILPSLAFLVLGAHALRAGDYFQLVMWIIMLVLVLFVRKDFMRYFLAGALSVGAFIWMDAAHGLLRFRLLVDMPYMRLAIIMGAVLLVMAGSLWFLASKRGGRVFHR